MQTNIGIIIQARMGSTRLPNKMNLPFYNSKTILQIIIERLKELKDIPIVLATTINPIDDVLIECALEQNILYFRGSEEDVLQRFIDTAQLHNFDTVIRVCADNPFLSLQLIEFLIQEYKKDAHFEYVSFQNKEGIPTIKTHYGFFAELVKLSALKKVANETAEKLYHEHVTNYMYSHAHKFKIKLLPIPFQENNAIRLTIDTQEDFINARRIYEQLMISNQEIEPNMILQYLSNHNEFFETMRHQINLQQK